MSNAEHKPLPKVLSININVWRDDSAIRTLPEIFSCWDNKRLAQIYTRAGLPSTKVCDEFLRINENAVIKSIFKRSTKTATRVYNTDTLSESESKELKEEQKRYKYAARHHSWFMTLCRDIVWLLGKWKTKELDEYIDKVNPDVLFVPNYPVVYMARLQKYIINRTRKPVVGFLADDNFSYKICGKNPFAYLHRFWLRKGSIELIKSCDKLFVIAPKTQEECKVLFGKDSELLTKAIDFSEVSYTPHKENIPLKMVYAGKLIIGRDKALMKIAEAVAKINAMGVKITFDVYAAGCPADKFLTVFKGTGCSFKGCVDKEALDKIQQDADILVFAESLDKRHYNAARLSFSTKITEYFKNGRCILALGSKEIAPVDYLIKEDAAVVITDYNDIEDKLTELCSKPELVAEYGKKAFECGKKNHDAKNVLGNFKKTICNLAEI